MALFRFRRIHSRTIPPKQRTEPAPCFNVTIAASKGLRRLVEFLDRDPASPRSCSKFQCRQLVQIHHLVEGQHVPRRDVFGLQPRFLLHTMPPFQQRKPYHQHHPNTESLLLEGDTSRAHGSWIVMTSEPTICFTNDTTSPDIVHELDISRLDAKLVDQQFFELRSFPLLKGS